MPICALQESLVPGYPPNVSIVALRAPGIGSTNPGTPGSSHKREQHSYESSEPRTKTHFASTDNASLSHWPATRGHSSVRVLQGEEPFSDVISGKDIGTCIPLITLPDACSPPHNSPICGPRGYFGIDVNQPVRNSSIGRDMTYNGGTYR